MLQQVSGRAGRTQKRGKVLIQTFNPYHQILQQVSTNDFEGMYGQQLEERYQYHYPPHFRTIKITLKDRNFSKMQKGALWYSQALKMNLGENVLGPEAPSVGRIRNLFITNILIKIPKGQSLSKTKMFMNKVERSFKLIKEFSRIRTIIDVDNY